MEKQNACLHFAEWLRVPTSFSWLDVLPALLVIFQVPCALDVIGIWYLESLQRSSQFSSEFPCLLLPNPLLCWDDVGYNFDQTFTKLVFLITDGTRFPMSHEWKTQVG